LIGGRNLGAARSFGKRWPVACRLLPVQKRKPGHFRPGFAPA